jgi:hypothetical protein
MGVNISLFSASSRLIAQPWLVAYFVQTGGVTLDLQVDLAMADAAPARARWEMENNVAAAGGDEVDALYRYNHEEQAAIQREKPWAKDPHYFKQWVQIELG